MEKIRVFLADSQVLYREGVRLALAKEGDIEVVGEANDGDAALIQIKALSPAVVIADYGLPRLDGSDLARQVSFAIRIPSMHPSKEKQTFFKWNLWRLEPNCRVSCSHVGIVVVIAALYVIEELVSLEQVCVM